MNIMSIAFVAIPIVFIAIGIIMGSFFTVRPQTVAVVERLGKFLDVRSEGLQFKIPFIDKVAGRVSLKTHDLGDIFIETRTKDGFLVKLNLNVQCKVLPASINEAFYKLENPFEKIASSIIEVISAEVIKRELDNLFLQEEDLKMAISCRTSDTMKEFGYTVVAALLRDTIEWKKLDSQSYNIEKPQHLRFS